MINLPPLPYDDNALEPTISAATMKLHHDKHHAKYVETVNALVGSEAASLESICAQAKGADQLKLRQNAGQAWNHAFFWNSMTRAETKPIGPLRDAIVRKFGDQIGLREAFLQAGGGHFGSGWVWLVADADDVSVVTTHDDGTLADGPGTPLLVCDLWEHAYYLDHQNNRAKYLEGWWDHLANWEFAEAQYRASQADREPWIYEEGSRPQPVVSREHFEEALEEVTGLLSKSLVAGSADDRRLTARLEQIGDYHESRAVEPTPEDRSRFIHFDERLKAFERRWPKRPPPGTPDHWQPSLGGGVAHDSSARAN